MCKCLYCYQPLEEGQTDFHPKCSKAFFGSETPPVIDFSLKDIDQLALSVVKSQITVPGVQPKLSLHLSNKKGEPQRFTIVGVLGNYILKPATTIYPHLPENESLTMHLAQIAKIKTVPFSLIRLKDNSLAYITRRIDRISYTKLPMEDLCQLTGRLTEHKYKGSHEQIAKAIVKYVSNTQFDVISFYEQIIFSFLTGNSDMHLKNFSLIQHPETGWHLAPAYDLLSTQLILDDTEELALTLNGKKSNLKRSDFEKAMLQVGINEKAIQNTFNRFYKVLNKWYDFVDNSFLPKKVQNDYKLLIENRAKRLF